MGTRLNRFSETVAPVQAVSPNANAPKLINLSLTTALLAEVGA